jgi:hypothetical protein
MTLVPKRIPILYLILAILIFVSLVPLYFYQQIVSINREELQRNEKLHQNAVTQFLARDIEQRQANLSSTLTTLAGAIQIASGGNLAGEHVNTPELRALVEQFVSSSHDVVYATLLNYEGKGTSAGRVSPDIFLQRELERAFMAAREARAFTGQAMTIGSGKEAHTVMLVSVPLVVENRFIGMIGAAIDLGFLIERLDDASKGHLVAYVVDRQGRLVAAPSGMFATGQDIRRGPERRASADAGHLQPGGYAGLGGGRPEASARGVPRGIRDAAYRQAAGGGGAADERGHLHLCGAPGDHAHRHPDQLQPRHRAR